MTVKECDNRMDSVLCRHAELLRLLGHAKWEDDEVYEHVCDLILQSHRNEALYISIIHENSRISDITLDIPKFIKKKEES